VHLDLMLRDKTRVRIHVPEGTSIDDAIDALLNRRGHYANGWVLVDEPERKYIAYGEIIQVRPVVRS
jgi:hypothetical protein